MTRPVLLDICCGAGGCSAGYYRAGFDIVGVDLYAQPHYPFPFIQCDGLEAIEKYGSQFDAIHASFPCQGYSRLRSLHPGKSYPKLIEPGRRLLKATGRPWVMENVESAPLRPAITLCGTMFGLGVYRHRLFESDQRLREPRHPAHDMGIADFGYVEEGKRVTVTGKLGNMPYVSKCMGIDWMTNLEIAEAIPPAYTEYVGRQLIERLKGVSP